MRSVQQSSDGPGIEDSKFGLGTLEIQYCQRRLTSPVERRMISRPATRAYWIYAVVDCDLVRDRWQLFLIGALHITLWSSLWSVQKSMQKVVIARKWGEFSRSRVGQDALLAKWRCWLSWTWSGPEDVLWNDPSVCSWVERRWLGTSRNGSNRYPTSSCIVCFSSLISFHWRVTP